MQGRTVDEQEKIDPLYQEILKQIKAIAGPKKITDRFSDANMNAERNRQRAAYNAKYKASL